MTYIQPTHKDRINKKNIKLLLLLGFCNVFVFFFDRFWQKVKLAQLNGCTHTYKIKKQNKNKNKNKNKKCEGEIAGVFKCKMLSAHPMMITNGSYQLFPQLKEEVETLGMVYEFNMTSVEGKKYFFSGRKFVKQNVDFLTATTTLFCVIFQGWKPGTYTERGIKILEENEEKKEKEESNLYLGDHSETDDNVKLHPYNTKSMRQKKLGDIIGRCVLVIKPLDFAKQLQTMTVAGTNSKFIKGLYFYTVILLFAFVYILLKNSAVLPEKKNGKNK